MCRSAYFLSVAILLLPFSARAQNGLQDANGNTSIFQGPDGGMAFSLDLNDSRAAFTYNSSQLGVLDAGGSVVHDAGPVCKPEQDRWENIQRTLRGDCMKPLCDKKCAVECSIFACPDRADCRQRCSALCENKNLRGEQLTTCRERCADDCVMFSCPDPGTCRQRCSAVCVDKEDAPSDKLEKCFDKASAASDEFKASKSGYAACLNRARPEQFILTNNATLAFAAQEGNRNLFSDSQFTPGVELHDKLGFTRTVGTNGLVALLGTADLEVVGRKVAEVSDTTVPSTIDLHDSVGTTLNLGGAVNWMPLPEAGLFGLSAQWQRDWNVPVATRTQNVCEIQTVGMHDGEPTTVSDCDDRYVGPVSGANGGVFRFDWISPRFDVSTMSFDSVDGYPDEGKGRAVQIDKAEYDQLNQGVAPALIFGSQISVRDERKPVYNVAVGPALFKRYQPLAILGAVLFEFDDLSNSSGEAPDFSDKFFVRLYIGVPFK